jgi:hypothetical protein
MLLYFFLAGINQMLIDYVLHTDHSKALYEKDSTSGRHIVRVSLDRPHAGAEWVTVPYKFMCKCSCDGGMNRRLTEVIFTLENERYRKFMSLLDFEVVPISIVYLLQHFHTMWFWGFPCVTVSVFTTNILKPSMNSGSVCLLIQIQVHQIHFIYP